MSTAACVGWDDADDIPEPVLCDFHTVTTRHLSNGHATQMARSCPECCRAAGGDCVVIPR